MSDLTDAEVEKLLSEWFKLKKQMKKLEEQDEKIKKLIHKEMDKQDVNKLESKNYVCNRRAGGRETLQKKDVPTSIWEQYAKKTNFKTLTLRKLDDE